MNSATLHTGSIVIDGHCDTLGDVLDGTRTLGERSNLGQVDLPRLKQGGVTAQIFACFVPVDQYRRGATRHALQRIDTFYQALEAYPKDLMFATTAADIRKAKRAHRMIDHGAADLVQDVPLTPFLLGLETVHTLLDLSLIHI